jgi:endonuclease YncB( thermonuclease family)
MNALRITVIPLLIFLIPAAYSDQLTGKVVGISDGDTITEQSQNIKVRLAEIDAPEKKQPWGQNSKQALSDLIFSLSVTVDSVGVDRYGRTLGTVFLKKVNINKHMVEHGNAWAYEKYVHDQNYFALQKNAQTRKVGLWSLSEDQKVAPWVWRKMEK